MQVASNSAVSFPSEPTLESNDIRRLKWLIYGPPGCGKSTLVSQAGDVLFLSTDAGMKFIKSMHRPIDTWMTFKKYVKAIQSEKPKQYKAICLDVVDSLARMCVKYICEKRGIVHQSDEPYGKAYDIILAEFETEIEKLVGAGKYGLFFISHAVDKERKTRFSTITKTEPTVPKQAYKILYPMMDVVAYMGFDPNSGPDNEASRRIYFQPTESMEAKDRTKLLPESLPLSHPDEGNGFEEIEKYLISGGKPKLKQVETSKKKIIFKKK